VSITTWLARATVPASRTSANASAMKITKVRPVTCLPVQKTASPTGCEGEAVINLKRDVNASLGSPVGILFCFIILMSLNENFLPRWELFSTCRKWLLASLECDGRFASHSQNISCCHGRPIWKNVGYWWRNFHPLKIYGINPDARPAKWRRSSEYSVGILNFNRPNFA